MNSSQAPQVIENAGKKILELGAIIEDMRFEIEELKSERDQLKERLSYQEKRAFSEKIVSDMVKNGSLYMIDSEEKIAELSRLDMESLKVIRQLTPENIKRSAAYDGILL